MPANYHNRIIYLDSLRTFLMILVIIYHTAMIYTLPQSFFYHELAPDFLTRSILSFFLSVTQSFFMGLLFFIAGYFTVKSVNKRGVNNFIYSKSIRFIPIILIYAFIICPVLHFLGNGINQNIFTFMLNSYSSAAAYSRIINVGPLWFTQTLLIFYLIYILIFDKINLFHFKTTIQISIKWILIIIVTEIIFTYISRIWFPIGNVFFYLTIPYIAQHFIWFMIGVYVYKYNWLNYLNKISKYWYITAFICICLWPIILMPSLRNDTYINTLKGGLTIQSFIYTVWEIFTGTCIATVLLGWFKTNELKFNKYINVFSRDSYGVLIIHTIFVTIFGIMFKNFQILSIFKFIIVSILSITISFISAHYISKWIHNLNVIFHRLPCIDSNR
jgi:glucans biosynthesis protein C